VLKNAGLVIDHAAGTRRVYQHGEDGRALRDAVSRDGGWTGLLRLFADEAGA